MKTRLGFVSNSSSSSFAVPIREVHSWDKNRPLTLSLEKIEKLLALGFRPTMYVSPSCLENSTMCMKRIEEVPISQADALAFQVVCNEEYVIKALLEIDVEFQASTHYGHETQVYKNGELYVIQNPGVAVEMYGLDYLKDMQLYGVQPVTITPRQIWLDSFNLDPPNEDDEEEDPDEIIRESNITLSEQPALANE